MKVARNFSAAALVRRVPAGLAIAGALLATFVGGAAASGDRARDTAAWPSAHGASTAPEASERIRPLRLDTDEGRFDRGTDNQGWWATRERNRDRNDNYLVGSPEHFAGIYRNFFTFDLSRKIERVRAAMLILRRYEGLGDATEVLGLFHVATGDRRLNDNQGPPSDRIFRDLGTGTRYGRFTISTSDRGPVRLRLNRAAVADINAARGGYFSIGGSLLSIDGDGERLFGFSNGFGTQRLLVKVREPATR